MTNSASSAAEPGRTDSPTLRKRRADQFSGLVWIGIGVFVVYLSKDLSYTDEYGPAAGFFPLWLGAIIVLLGAILLIKVTWIDKEDEGLSFFSKRVVSQMCSIVAGILGFIFLIERAGFFLSAGLLFLFLLVAVERRGWKFSLAVSIAAGLAFWGIFGLALKQQLPMGILQKLFY